MLIRSINKTTGAATAPLLLVGDTFDSLKLTISQRRLSAKFCVVGQLISHYGRSFLSDSIFTQQ
ncbi:MAG: hypothetical protein AB1489_11935, partial [Acidobacteriota bacterium]